MVLPNRRSSGAAPTGTTRTSSGAARGRVVVNLAHAGSARRSGSAQTEARRSPPPRVQRALLDPARHHRLAAPGKGFAVLVHLDETGGRTAVRPLAAWPAFGVDHPRLDRAAAHVLNLGPAARANPPPSLCSEVDCRLETTERSTLQRAPGSGDGSEVRSICIMRPAVDLHRRPGLGEHQFTISVAVSEIERMWRAGDA